MKRKFILFLLSVALLVQPAAMIPAYTANAATTGSSGKKLNLLSTTQCIVFEPNYKAEDSLNLIPGTSFTKDPYVKSESRYDAYCFARVEIPTTTFTTAEGTDVVGDAVKMLYSGKEGINTSDWKAVKEIPSATPGTNSVYIFEYVGNGGVLTKQASTGRIFDSMTMPSTVSVAGVSKHVASVDDVTGSVSVQGFLISSADAKDASDAYNSIKDELEETSNNTSNSNKYDDKIQGTVDVLQDEKRDLENQVKALEERLSTKLSTGDAKANQVIEGKIFSNADAVDLTGTMPNYDKGYYGSGNTSEIYSWTDLSGKVNTEKKEGYQTKIESGTGLTRNSDGTITISAGYHAEQVVQGASGNAVPSQVVKGVSFSNSSGPQTGTMETITSGDYKISDSGVVSVTTGKYTGTASTSANQYQITNQDITRIVQNNNDLKVTANDAQVLSGYTYYGAKGKSTGTMTNYGYEPTASSLGIYNPGDGNYLYSYLPTNSVDNTGDAGNGYVQRSVKTKLANLGNASPAHVLSGETFTSSAGLAVRGTMENRGGYTPAHSWARGNGTTYIRFPMGAYLTSANNGLNLPEITVADNLYSQTEYDQNYINGQRSVSLSMNANGRTVTATTTNGKSASRDVNYTGNNGVVSITGNGNKGWQSYDITDGWATSVNVDQTAAYNAGWIAGQTYNNSIPEYEYVAIGAGYFITHEAPLSTKIHIECEEGSFGIGRDHGNHTNGLDAYYGTIKAGETKDISIWNGGIFNINGRSVGINRAKVWIYNEIWGGLN